MENANIANVETAQSASEISQRIKQLCNFDGDTLETEMAQLKVALLENPSACALIMDEDVGLLVSNLKRTVRIAAMLAEENKKKPKKSKELFTAEQMQNALDEE